VYKKINEVEEYNGDLENTEIKDDLNLMRKKLFD
jgi:hypothetical protein